MEKISAKTPYYEKSVFLSAKEAATFVTDDWYKASVEKRSIDIANKLYRSLWPENVDENEEQ